MRTAGVALLVVLFGFLSATGRARAYACPDGFVPSVDVGILRGTQVVRAGAQVPMRADTGDCKYSHVIPAANLEITVASSPDGPFAPLAGVRRLRDRFVWRPAAPGIYYVRVTVAGRAPARLIPAQLAFVVFDRSTTARVRLEVPSLPRMRDRTHLMLGAVLPELAGRDDWAVPIAAIPMRGEARRRITARLPRGRWLASRGRTSYEKDIDLLGPGALLQNVFEPLGEIQVAGDATIALPRPAQPSP